MCTERIGPAIASRRQTAKVLSRRPLTVADVTALDRLPPAPTAEAWRLQALLLRVSEAAELPSVRPSWVYEVVPTSLLTYWRVGRRIPFTRQMLEAWPEAQHHA
jgi:hypothetical protein